MNILELWLIFAILAVICKSGYYLLQKQYLNDDASPYTTAYISSVYATLITTPPAIWEILKTDFQLSWSVIGLLILFGIAETVYLLVYLFALNNLNLSIASPFKKAKPAVLAFVEPIVLSASIPIVVAISAILTAIGGVLTVVGGEDSLDSYKNDITKIGLLFAGITLLMSVTMSLISRFGASEISPFIFGSGVSITMLATTRFLLYNSDVESMSISLTSKKGFYLGLIGGFRSLFVWLAYALATATLVSTVTQTTLILDVLLARYYLKESVTKKQAIGITILFIGTFIAIIMS